VSAAVKLAGGDDGVPEEIDTLAQLGRHGQDPVETGIRRIEPALEDKTDRPVELGAGEASQVRIGAQPVGQRPGHQPEPQPDLQIRTPSGAVSA